MNKLSLVLVLIIAVAFPATSIYAWQAQLLPPQREEWTEGYTESGAIETSVHFLKNSPTYKFDGIPESINVLEASSMRPPAPEWLVVIEFECRHAGYGDRTGKVLAQVITPHTIIVIVKEGEVVKADIDDKWDELNQCEIVRKERQPPEFGRDTAIDYILQSHEGLGDLQVPSSWETRDLTPGLVGVSNLQYIGDGWTVNVTSPVVAEPTYTVEIEHTGEVCFHWKGTVDQDGNVVEMDFAVVQ